MIWLLQEQGKALVLQEGKALRQFLHIQRHLAFIAFAFVALALSYCI